MLEMTRLFRWEFPVCDGTNPSDKPRMIAMDAKVDVW